MWLRVCSGCVVMCTRDVYLEANQHVDLLSLSLSSFLSSTPPLLLCLLPFSYLLLLVPFSSFSSFSSSTPETISSLKSALGTLKTKCVANSQDIDFLQTLLTDHNFMALVRTNDSCSRSQSFKQPEGNAEDCIKGVS